MGIKSSVEKLGKKLEHEWGKSWRERSNFSNTMLAIPKIAVRMVSSFITPFPNTFRKFNQEVDRDSEVQVKNLKTSLLFNGKRCVTLSKQKLSAAQLKTNNQGHDYDLILSDKRYELFPVREYKGGKPYDVTNNQGHKLYEIKKFGEDKQNNHVVWITRDGQLNTVENGQVIRKKASNKLQAITVVPYDERTGEVQILLLIIWPTGLAAKLLKHVGALVKIPFDVTGKLFCSAQDKLLSGLDLRYTAKTECGIEYTKPQSYLDKPKLILGNICGFLGNGLKFIGTTVNETLRFSAAIVSTPSALCGPTYREIKKQHLLTAGESLLNNIAAGALGTVNMKLPERPDGVFHEKIEQLTRKQPEIINTVDYGGEPTFKAQERDNSKVNKITESLNKAAKKLGMSLLSSGVKSNSSEHSLGSARHFDQNKGYVRAV